MRDIRRYILICQLLTTAAVLLPSSVAAQDPEPPKPERPERERPERERLGERLIREAAANRQEDVMDTALRLMDDAARNLEVDFDAGAKTQDIQARILEKLDKAIQTAAAQRRASRSRSSTWTGERRKMKPQGRPEDSPTASSGEDSESAGQATVPGGGTEPIEPGRGDLRELRRTWGLLPQRDRDELIQGSKEAFLERYREWIERYYRALQEAPE